MTATASTAPVAGRLMAPDLIRGVMLLFIAIANVSWYLWGHEGPGVSIHVSDGSRADSIAAAVTMVTVDGRIYPMFAFLFGYGMVQFYESRARRGEPDTVIRRSLFRRHWALLLFGFLHALLLFVGDVLGAYAVVGLIVMALFFRRSTLTLVIWLLVLGGLVIGMVLSQALLMGLLAALESSGMLAGEDLGTASFSTATARDLGAGEAVYWVSALWRVGLWAAGTVMQVLLTLTVPFCILAGVLAARFGVLAKVGEYRALLVRIAGWGIAVAWLAGLPAALAFLGVIPGEGVALGIAAPAAQALGIAGGFGYVALLALAGDRLARAVPWLVRGLTAVGRRSLSCYLAQSIVMAPLLSAWGLGLGSRVGTLGAIGIAAATWALTLVLAMIWHARGWRGPFEIVLRGLTHGKATAPGAAGPRPDPEGHASRPRP